jgi:hypothetical protein
LELCELAAGNGQDDGEREFNHFAGSLYPGCEFADDHRPGITGKNILDIELDRFGQAAEATDKLGNCPAAGLPPPNPRQGFGIAWDFETTLSLNMAAITSGSFLSPKLASS